MSASSSAGVRPPVHGLSGAAGADAERTAARTAIRRRSIVRLYRESIITWSWVPSRHDASRIPRARPARRPVGVRLRLAHVVAGIPLRREVARARARLPPLVLHLFHALPRYPRAARPGDGPLPGRLVLGHGVPRP